jgi:hypothetical protein
MALPLLLKGTILALLVGYLLFSDQPPTTGGLMPWKKI